MTGVKAHAYLAWLKREAVSLVSIGLLIGVAVGVAVGVSNVASLDGRLAGVLRMKRDNDAMQLKEDVTTANGNRTITVITTQGEGPGVPPDETVDQMIDRHNTAVAKVQKIDK